MTALAPTAQAVTSEAQEANPILFTDVHVFNGVSDARGENASVLAEGNLISAFSTDPIEADGPRVIGGGVGTLLSSLIEAHGHIMRAAERPGRTSTAVADAVAGGRDDSGHPHHRALAAAAELGLCASRWQTDAFVLVLFLSVLFAAWSVGQVGISVT